MKELSPRRYSADPSTLKVGPQGRLVIPANLRRSLNLQAGIELVARAEDGQLVLETLDNLRRRLRERYQGTRSTSMADELIAERRQEALRELERENPS